MGGDPGDGSVPGQRQVRLAGSAVAAWACTQARMAAHPVVLCGQDTTELDFNAQVIIAEKLTNDHQRDRLALAELRRKPPLTPARRPQPRETPST